VKAPALCARASRRTALSAAWSVWRPLTRGGPTMQRQPPQRLVVGRIAAGVPEPPLRRGVLPARHDVTVVGEQLPRDQAGGSRRRARRSSRERPGVPAPKSCPRAPLRITCLGVIPTARVLRDPPSPQRTFLRYHEREQLTQTLPCRQTCPEGSRPLRPSLSGRLGRTAVL
jgi:hypothetical protein